MVTDPSLLSILPNLSIGVVCVFALVYVVIQFLKALKEGAEKHQAAMDRRAERYEQAMEEREQALRDVESHVRNTLATALTQSTIALEQNSRVLARVARQLDEK